MKTSILASLVCVLALVISQSDGFGDDMFDFAKTQLNGVSEKVIKSLHRVGGGGRPRPPLPDKHRPGKKKLGNNKYVSAMLQVNKAMAVAQGRRLSFKPGFLKTLARLAVNANELKEARDVFGYGLYEDYKQYKKCLKSGRSGCNPGSGGISGQIRALIGDEDFNRLMAVEGNVDLIFTIDTTGSMAQEIKAAKQIVRSIATYSREAAVKYTLSPFNDPGTGPVRRFTDRAQFLQALDNIRVHGGGDCKELTFHGIYNAIEQTKPPIDSPMFVFTDAGPKDENAPDINRDDATGKALDYFVPVSFFYSKNPGGCRQPELFESFNEIVDATEGMSMLFDSKGKDIQKMGEIITSSLDGMTTVKSGRVVVSPTGRRGPSLVRRLGRIGIKRNSIPVDDSIEKLIVMITVERSAGSVVLRDPSRRSVPRTYNLLYGAIWVIKRPRRGVWILEVPTSVGSHSYKVTSSSVLNIDFDHYFVRRLPGNNHVEIPLSDPLIGQPAIVKVLIPLKNKLRVNSLYLDTVDKYGRTLSTSRLAGTTATFPRPPSVPFKLRLRGITNTLLPFERLSRKIITAKSVIIRMVYNRNYFALARGRNTRVRFAIHNSGSTDTFRVNLAISLAGVRVIRGPRAAGYSVRSGGQRYVSATLHAPASFHRGKFMSLFVTATGMRTGVKARLNVQLMVM